MPGDRSSCACEDCQHACRVRPGWFLPGEAALTAAWMGMSLRSFFQRFLAVDWLWVKRHQRTVFLLAPRIVGAEGGTEYPAEPFGQCVFFQDGRCAIHAVKPYECHQYLHGETPQRVSRRSYAMAARWMRSQEEVTDVLGREPMTKPKTAHQRELESVGIGR